MYISLSLSLYCYSENTSQFMEYNWRLTTPPSPPSYHSSPPNTHKTHNPSPQQQNFKKQKTNNNKQKKKKHFFIYCFKNRSKDKKSRFLLHGLCVTFTLMFCCVTFLFYHWHEMTAWVCVLHYLAPWSIPHALIPSLVQNLYHSMTCEHVCACVRVCVYTYRVRYVMHY